MDIYDIWFNLRPGIKDVELCDRLQVYLGRLVDLGKIGGFRVMRRKLALGHPALGEFHVMIEVTDLAQLDNAFRAVGARSGEIESLHAAVNQSVTDFSAALYRDFPDPMRVRGQEQF